MQQKIHRGSAGGSVAGLRQESIFSLTPTTLETGAGNRFALISTSFGFLVGLVGAKLRFHHIWSAGQCLGFISRRSSVRWFWCIAGYCGRADAFLCFEPRASQHVLAAAPTPLISGG